MLALREGIELRLNALRELLTRGAAHAVKRLPAAAGRIGRKIVLMYREHDRGRRLFDDLPALLHIPPLEAFGRQAVQPAFVRSGQNDLETRVFKIFFEGVHEGKIDLALLYARRFADDAAVDAAVPRVEHHREESGAAHARRDGRKAEGQQHDAGENCRRRDQHTLFDG